MTAIAANITAFPDRQSWLDYRRDPDAGRIGASEVATVLGLNPFESAFTLFHKKREVMVDNAEPLWLRLGLLLEPVIADLYRIETGRMVDDPGDYTVYGHPDYPWLSATPDRIVHFEDDREGPLEMKSMGESRAKALKEADSETLLEHQCQVQIQMACMQAERGTVAALIGNRRFTHHDFDRNDRFLGAAIVRLKEFHDRLLSGDAPAPDGSESTFRTLTTLHPKDNGATVELPAEALDIDRELQDLKDAQKELESQIGARQNWLREKIGDATFGEFGRVRYSWKTQTRKEYTVQASECRVLRKVKS